MKYYDSALLRTLDLDLFGEYKGLRIHVATNGGYVPRDLAAIEEIERKRDEVERMQEEYSVELNKEYVEALDGYEYLEQAEFDIDDHLDIDSLKNVFGESLKAIEEKHRIKAMLYCESFVHFAKRGFISFDRVGYGRGSGQLYEIVAWPAGSPYDEACREFITAFRKKPSNVLELLSTRSSRQRRGRNPADGGL